MGARGEVKGLLVQFCVREPLGASGERQFLVSRNSPQIVKEAGLHILDITKVTRMKWIVIPFVVGRLFSLLIGLPCCGLFISV